MESGGTKPLQAPPYLRLCLYLFIFNCYTKFNFCHLVNQKPIVSVLNSHNIKQNAKTQEKENNIDIGKKQKVKLPTL